jgi:hypothetical protein
VNDGQQEKRRQLNGKGRPGGQGGMLEMTGRAVITGGDGFFGVKKIDGQEDEQEEQHNAEGESGRFSVRHRLRQF